MGKRGPKPKPSATKQLEGTYRPDRAPRNEVKPAPVEHLKCSPQLSKDRDAKRLWDDLAPRLKRLGLYTELDTPALEGLCLAYGKACQADRAVRTYGVVSKTEFGIRANPAVQMSRAAWAEVRRFAAEFGMSPSARTRVDVEPASAGGDTNQPPTDSVENFLFGKIAGSIPRTA